MDAFDLGVGKKPPVVSFDLEKMARYGRVDIKSGGFKARLLGQSHAEKFVLDQSWKVRVPWFNPGKIGQLSNPMDIEPATPEFE